MFLFDLWGVIIEGGHTYPGIVENINKIIKRKKVYFVTNAPRSIFSLHQTIKSWGVNVLPEMITSSGEIAVEMILESTERFGMLMIEKTFYTDILAANRLGIDSWVMYSMR